MRSIIKIPLLACLSLLFVLTSCTKESVSVSEFADESLFLVESETRSGKKGCYELIFPVTVEFADGTSQEVDSSEELKAAIIAWKEANEEIDGRPHLAFPYDIVTEDGTIITVESREQMHFLRKKCRAEMGPGPHGDLGKPCFRIVYPISVTFPDGASKEVESRWQLKKLLRTWRINHPDSEERPTIDFPIVVKFEDGTTQTVEDKEALKALKAECRG